MEDTFVRAVHVNELRRAVEFLRRGRWTLPLYAAGGLFSMLPDNPWPTGYLSNNGTNELRAAAFGYLVTSEPIPRGLAGLTVRATSGVRITASKSCTIQVYRCKRVINFDSDTPTWNEYGPIANLAWATPGGLGAADAELIGSVSCPENVPATLSGAAVAAAVQTMLAGQPQTFIFRRSNVHVDSTYFTPELVVEFDVNGPPN